MRAPEGRQSRERPSAGDGWSRGRLARGGPRRRAMARVSVMVGIAFMGAAAQAASPTDTAGTSRGTWRLLPAAPIDLVNTTSVWTGREVLFASFDVQSGAAYDPATNGWRRLPTGPAPTGAAQGGSFGVWTGRELLLSGHANAAYNPAANRWRRLPPPSNFGGNPAVVAWTGARMIQWGGGCCGDFGAAGSAYSPATNRWRSLPASPLAGRRASASAWTGKELVTVGGYTEEPTGPRRVITDRPFADAAAYNPTTRSWRRLPPLPVPRLGATAAWDGRQVLVVGGTGVGRRLLVGVFGYRPSTNRWQRLRPMPRGRDGFAGFVAVWTGKRLLVWGGWTVRNGRRIYPRTGLAFDPIADRWSPLLPASPFDGRTPLTAVWTGTSMIATSGGVAAAYTP